ncbi:peroxin-2, partial [Phenoliferia sp. Uapishka_3]
MSTAAEEAKFWLPPPPQTSSLPSIRTALPTFPSPPLRVSRVGQLDGALLDQELEGILAGPLWKACEGLRVAAAESGTAELGTRDACITEDLDIENVAVGARSNLWIKPPEPEIPQRASARRRIITSSADQSTAIDSSLTKVQKSAYMALEVLPAYLYARIRDRMLSAAWSDESLPTSWFSLVDIRRFSKQRRRETGEEEGDWRGEWKRVVWEVLGLGERLAAIAGLANFLVFLYDGRYRTLVDRLLGMRLIYAERSVSRNVSFEFLNRQLVWEAFTEFLLFLVPLVNMHRLRLRAARLLSSTASGSKTLATIVSALPSPIARALRLPVNRPPPLANVPVASTSTLPPKRPEGPFHFLPPKTCPVCYSNATALPDAANPSDSTLSSSTRTAGVTEDTTVKLPYITDCGWECRYCYYCVVGRLASAEEDGEDAWPCMRCGGEVTGVSKEVLEIVEKATGGGVEKVDDGSGDGDDEAEDEVDEDADEEERPGYVGSVHEQDRWRE